jgi:hypothetical protein
VSRSELSIGKKFLFVKRLAPARPAAPGRPPARSAGGAYAAAGDAAARRPPRRRVRPARRARVRPFVIALVTGSSGFVGSHLVEALAGAGWEVRRMVRPESPATGPSCRRRSRGG